MNDTAPDTPPTRLHLADAVARVAASTVGVLSRRRGLAAGVVWKPGVVLTAASALGHGSRVHVALPSGQTVVSDIRGVDSSTDLAVLTLPDETLPPAERHLSPPPRVGDFVFVVGRDASGNVHASFGHLGATGGAWRTWRGGRVDALLRLDGGLYAGLAGAPVADAQGQVLGVASPALSRQHGVVLPVSTVDRVAATLLAHGRVARGYLGVAAQPVALTAAMQAAAGTTARAGLLLAGMADDGPAVRAGLMVGDIVVAAGGREVNDIDSLRELLGAEQVGARLRLQLLRGGQPVELVLDVAENPGAPRCG